jgi:hypothetical protein
MTQKINLPLEPCIVCGSSDFDQTVLGTSLADASDFTNKDETQSLFLYELVTCLTCNHSSIQTDNPCWMPTRKHDFIKYGEPTEHYSQISETLKTLNLEFNEVSVHTFSYKDFQLANLLASDLNIPGLELKNFAGCSGDWLPSVYSSGSIGEPKALTSFITEIRDSKKTHKIILITRFFDHVHDRDLLQTVLKLYSPSTHIVFDLNDYDRLFELDTLEFVWNERRNFFTQKNLASLLNKASVKFSTFTYESKAVSPTLTGIISSRLPADTNSDEAILTQSTNPHLGDRLISLRQLWQLELKLGHKLAIIGASHKGISLAQFVLGPDTNFSLHDDKEALKDKTPPVIPPLGFHLISGFDFSKYSHVAMTTTRAVAEKITPKLRDSGFTGQFLDFDCRALS